MRISISFLLLLGCGPGQVMNGQGSLLDDGGVVDEHDGASGDEADAGLPEPDAMPLPGGTWTVDLADRQELTFDIMELAYSEGDSTLVASTAYRGALLLAGTGLPAASSVDGLVVKLDAGTGALVWARAVSGPYDDRLEQVAAAPDGSVWVFGHLDGGTETFTFTFAGQSVSVDFNGLSFLARYSASGQEQALLVIKGLDGYRALTVDSAGVPYLGLNYWNHLEVGNMVVDTTSNERSIAVVRLDPTTAAPTWITPLLATTRVVNGFPQPACSAYMGGLSVAGGKVFVVGGYGYTLDVAGLPTLTTTGNQDTFIVALDAASGGPLWSRGAGALGHEQWRDITVVDGELVTTGLTVLPGRDANGVLPPPATFTYGAGSVTAVDDGMHAIFVGRTRPSDGAPLDLVPVPQVGAGWGDLQGSYRRDGRVLASDHQVCALLPTFAVDFCQEAAFGEVLGTGVAGPAGSVFSHVVRYETGVPRVSKLLRLR